MKKDDYTRIQLRQTKDFFDSLWADINSSYRQWMALHDNLDPEEFTEDDFTKMREESLNMAFWTLSRMMAIQVISPLPYQILPDEYIQAVEEIRAELKGETEGVNS